MAKMQISIQEVYSRIKTGEDGDFTLRIIRSSGKLKGHEKVSPGLATVRRSK